MPEITSVIFEFLSRDLESFRTRGGLKGTFVSSLPGVPVLSCFYQLAR
jgi:hypothetical protein